MNRRERVGVYVSRLAFAIQHKTKRSIPNYY